MTLIKAEFKGGPLDGKTEWVPGGSSARDRIYVAKRPEIPVAGFWVEGPVGKPDFDVDVYELDLLASNYAVYFHRSFTVCCRPSQMYRFYNFNDPLLLWFSMQERLFHDALENSDSRYLLSIVEMESIHSILNSKAGRSARRRRMRKK